MTHEQFTQWLVGFMDAVGELPTPDQWAVLKAKLADIKHLGKLHFQPGARVLVPVSGGNVGLSD